jgi:putative methyltransferase (TIGR04325 family)
MIGSGIRPTYILINRVPLYSGQRFVTLQNGGLVYYPQYVFNREEYIGAIMNFGYRLIDCWDDTFDSCVIPFHHEKSLPNYKGLLFAMKRD